MTKFFLLSVLLWSFSSNAQVIVEGSAFGDDLYPCGAGVTHPADPSPICYFAGTKNACDPSNDNHCVCYQSKKDSDHVTFEPAGTVFQFGSERFGASYFVDLCYKGPTSQIKTDLDGKKQDLTEGIYFLTASVSLTGAAGNYAALSGLESTFSYVCDLRGSGEIESATSPAPLASRAISFQTQLNTAKINVPQSCKVRVTLNETLSQGIRDSVQLAEIVTLSLDVSKDNSR